LVDVGNAAKLWKGWVVDKVVLFCIAIPEALKHEALI